MLLKRGSLVGNHIGVRLDSGRMTARQTLFSSISPVPISQQSQSVYIEEMPDVQSQSISSCQSKGQSTATGSGKVGKLSQTVKNNSN